MERRGRQRKIIHCDCDSFYASVEERDDPSLVGQPLAVGGSPDTRGVVATCNYAARNLGVHSAMPMSRALKIIPWLIVVPTNMEKYRAASKSVHKIFKEYKFVEGSHVIDPHRYLPKLEGVTYTEVGIGPKV
mgnify:CR=1 FL=1